MIRRLWRKKWRGIAFCLIYPVLAVSAMALYAVSREAAGRHPFVYGFSVFGIAVIIVALMGAELIKRKWKHQLQGDKLKIREKEGIQLEGMED